jgi:hypothetical protein
VAADVDSVGLVMAHQLRKLAGLEVPGVLQVKLPQPVDSRKGVSDGTGGDVGGLGEGFSAGLSADRVRL